MNKFFFLGITVIIGLVGLSFFSLNSREAVGINVANQTFSQASNTTPVYSKSRLSSEQVEPMAKEDPDLMAFIKSLMSLELTEKLALNLIRSDLSQNKKAVVLETYNEMGGSYSEDSWSSTLRDLLLSADEWPELANKVSQSLRRINASGELDEVILHDIRQLPADELVKRTALADILFGKVAVESAIAEASSLPELEVLSTRHAALISQSEKLRQFETSQDPSVGIQYLKSYIASSQSLEEMHGGLTKGLAAKNIKPELKTGLLFAVSASHVPGKSIWLFDNWKGLLPQAKKHRDYFGVLNLAIQEAAYSEPDYTQAKIIMRWLADQPTLDPTHLDDPRIDLSIAMVNACGHQLVKQDHCSELRDIRRTLEAKLKHDGLAGYID